MRPRRLLGALERELLATAMSAVGRGHGALQVFRGLFSSGGLFSSELFRPGEWISAGSPTVLFTDVRDSTSFYRVIGDAPPSGASWTTLGCCGRRSPEKTAHW